MFVLFFGLVIRALSVVSIVELLRKNPFLTEKRNYYLLLLSLMKVQVQNEFYGTKSVSFSYGRRFYPNDICLFEVPKEHKVSIGSQY